MGKTIPAPRLLSLAGVVTVLAGALGLVAWQAAGTPLTMYDEPLWYARSQRPIWDTADPHEYFRATDVPGMVRVVYGAALRLTGTHNKHYVQADYGDTHLNNRRRGVGAPADAVMVMRGCNVIAFVGALAALYFVALRVLRHRWLAGLCLTPFLVSPIFPLRVVPRVGPDMLLMTWLCVFLVAWLIFHERGTAHSWYAAVVLGALGGICTFAKINGALPLFGYAGYAVVTARGWRRLLLPLLALAVGFALFYVLNPSFLGYRPDEVILDILRRRMHMRRSVDSLVGPMGRLELWSKLFPCWPLIPVLLVLAWRARKAWWFVPVGTWGLALVVGTAAMINRPSPRFLTPLELGLYFPACLCIIWLCVTRRAGEP